MLKGTLKILWGAAPHTTEPFPRAPRPPRQGCSRRRRCAETRPAPAASSGLASLKACPRGSLRGSLVLKLSARRAPGPSQRGDSSQTGPSPPRGPRRGPISALPASALENAPARGRGCLSKEPSVLMKPRATPGLGTHSLLAFTPTASPPPRPQWQFNPCPPLPCSGFSPVTLGRHLLPPLPVSSPRVS